MGYLKSIGTAIIYIGFFLAVITFLPGLPPEATFSEYSIKQPSDIKIQNFELKNRLRGAEVLFSGELIGPEGFAAYNGEIYTGIRGGYVVKMEGNHIKPVVKFGKKCDGLWQEERCGRPLDLKFNDKGELFVTDAYYGIFKVNVNTRQYVNIVNSSEPIDGKVPKVVNSLDIAKNGDIYWTDSTTDFPLHDGMYSFFANPSGRLIRYNAATKKNEVLVKNLGFANGVLLSDDESFVIALECLTSRIIKYNLKGPKAGQKEIFAEALPGLPDNVYSDQQGGFLVSLLVYIDANYPFLPQSLMPHPYIRKMLSRLLYSIEAPFKLLQDVYPNYYAEKVLHTVGSFDASKILDVKQTSVILRMDKTGKVLDALYSEDGKVHTISAAYIHNDYLWLGSPWNDYVMRVPLKQAFPQLAAKEKYSTTKEQKKEEPLLTVTGTPNIKVEAKPANAKPAVQQTTPKPNPKPTAKAQPTQKPNSDATASKPSTATKPTTPQPSTTTPKPTPAPSKSSTNEIRKDSVKEVKKENLKEIKKDNAKDIKKDSAREDQKDNLKQMKKDNSKEIKENNSKEIKKDNLKEIKKDNSKEIKIDNSKQIKKEDNSKEIKKDNLKEIKKDNSNSDIKPQATKKSSEGMAKPKPEDPVKKGAREAQSVKSKPVEKDEPNKQ